MGEGRERGHLRITPGIHPRIERRMLIRKSALQPRFKKTARGGRKMARKYRQTLVWRGEDLLAGSWEEERRAVEEVEGEWHNIR
jgi:hypothetical protein